MKMYDTEEDMIQNLKDAGCGNKQIQELVELYRKNKKDDIYQILTTHRKKVLDKIHKNEKQIECIDYFIYKMK